MSQKKELIIQTLIKGIVARVSVRERSTDKVPELAVSVTRTVKFNTVSLAFTYGRLDDCYLNIRDTDCTLWVSRTAFDIRPIDADLLASTFGLRVAKETKAGEA